MLFRPVVIDTIESTLENSPNAFNSIWVRHAIYKFLGRMPHTLMFILITKIYITSVSSVYRVESGLMFSLTAFFRVSPLPSSIGMAFTRPLLSLMPITAVLPFAPPRGFCFLLCFLFLSKPPK